MVALEFVLKGMGLWKRGASIAGEMESHASDTVMIDLALK